ncbi:hypothetical protein HMPREF1549_01685 [Actinomyces johnsonii F0510]|uniref:Uncharacterized protein n=1 Tax=Actinomyces johnsonii F0510 TaxID=1227262 RepID=U1PQV2_9ACTO|nr:hypothetical protein HMPREF1549_01685 [Actinomyces johnsonii F0510]
MEIIWLVELAEQVAPRGVDKGDTSGEALTGGRTGPAGGRGRAAYDSVEAVEEGEEGILIVKIDGSDLDIGSAETVYLIDETMDASGYSCAQTQIGPDTR